MDHICSQCHRSFKTTGGLKIHVTRTHPATTATIATADVIAPEPPTQSESEFRTVSVTLTRSLSAPTKHENGIYFTPLSARKRLLEVVNSHITSPVDTALEPSFGSGEFIYDMLTAFPTATLYGCEKEVTLFNSVQKTLNGDTRVQLVHGDFRNYAQAPVDLIVGNPPYVVTNEKVPECMSGRGNLYVHFIYLCLQHHLKPVGILAFVLPTSLYNASYYEPCRKYLKTNTTVLHVENLSVKYLETAQDTMLLVVRKTPDTAVSANPYILECGDKTYILPDAQKLKQLMAQSTSLQKLGLEVKTGRVVWNQHKDKLTSDPTGNSIPVLYSSNITGDHDLVLHTSMSGEKAQYIRDFNGAEPLSGPAILISRGYGNKYKFMFGVVRDTAFKFHGENHTNVIYPTTAAASANLSIVERSLVDPRTEEFVRHFAGNGALSKTELETVLPIFT